MLGPLSLVARHPLLSGATGLAVVAALSGGVALASAESSGAAPTAATDLSASLSADGTSIVSRPVAPVPDQAAQSRAAASAQRAGLAAAAHRRQLAAAAAAEAARARVAAERREAAARASRDLQRARIAASDPRTIARGLVSARGWSDSEYSCLDKLWSKESGWQTEADNPSSSAYGIPQALPGSKMASAGDDWRTSATTQITWGLDYIDDRYGTPCSAWSHSRGSNWY